MLMTLARWRGQDPLDIKRSMIKLSDMQGGKVSPRSFAIRKSLLLDRVRVPARFTELRVAGVHSDNGRIVGKPRM